jgi:hypothetical protein
MSAPVQIFISYARDDDERSPDLKVEGFVTFLIRELEYEFRKLGEPKPKLWRDLENIRKSEQFGPKIEEAVNASSIFVVVMSRTWPSRPYCVSELECFTRRWSNEGDQGLRRRVVVVGKAFLPPDERPELLRGQQGHNFFDDRRLVEAGEEESFYDRGPPDERYFPTVKGLARDLWRKAKGEIGPRPPSEPANKPASLVAPIGRTIYVAKTPNDMRRAYDRVVQELQGRGYTVVPESDIPNDESATGFIDQALAAAEASVHLLGESVGYAPENAAPISKLQLARAAARVSAAALAGEVTSRSFRRLIWAPRRPNDDAASEAAGERDPLKVLDKFDRPLATDKIEGDNLSKFVDFLTQNLAANVPQNKEREEGKISAGAKVYVYHRPEDALYAGQITRALKQHQLRPVLPAIEGDEANLNAFNKKQLLECDAVVICWATAEEVWARAQSNALKNWEELGRKEKFAVRGLVAGPPPGGRKLMVEDLFLDDELDVILDLTSVEQPSKEHLNKLVREVRPKDK